MAGTRIPSRRQLTVGIAGFAVVAVAATAGVAAVMMKNDDQAPRSAVVSDLDPAVSICGFPGDRVSAIVADGPAHEDPPARGAPYLIPSGDGEHVTDVHITETGPLVEVQRDDGSRRFLRPDGGEVAEADFVRDSPEPHNNGDVAVAPDGRIFAIDSYQGRRDVAIFDSGGTQVGGFAVPSSRVTEGHPLDLYGVVWVPDLDGKPAVLVGERGTLTHVFREDGTYLGVSDALTGAIVDASGNLVTVIEVVDDDTASLRVVDVSSETTVMRVVYAPPSDGAGSGTPGLVRPRNVVPAPSGDGFLIYEAGQSLTWVDSIGIRRGVWLGTAEMSPSQVGAIVESGGEYWLTVVVESEETLLQLSSDELAGLLAQPVSYKAQNAQALAQLGVGVGVVSDAALNHTDWGDEQDVRLRFEEGWGELGDAAPAEELEFRYSVRGDPLAAQPISQDERAVEPIVGGGEVQLDLPEPVPGPYELSMRLVDGESGATLAASCFRYSIGAPGADLELGTLADGDDWGGPEPLRGVQLADRLGIGSFRVQLDFGGLIAEPSSPARLDGVNWAALPGAPDEPQSADDAFAQIREAADYAERHGVRVIVQVGQNGDAERAAVDAGTWGDWARIIVSQFAESAPGITAWSPWNEPNLSFDSGADFSERVDIPFADAAHAADPDAEVIAGNTLGFAGDWWADAVTTPLCGRVDALAVHPYTGWNRSWEEEGFADEGGGYRALRQTLGETCAELPLWDTESGWTSDGTLPYWTQGAKVARKLIWNQVNRIAGWTYFFSEGGWGENNLSWSLIQYRSHVKPGALAFATVSQKLAALGHPTPIDSDVPFTHVTEFEKDAGTIAAWTDEAHLTVVLTGEASSVTVTDQYGATRTVGLIDGRAEVVLTSDVQFFASDDGTPLSLSAPESYGADVLAGAEVSATSSAEDSDPQIITSGTVNPYLPWRSGTVDGEVDEGPSVTITLDEPTTVDRIAVASGGMECCETALRSYTVSVLTEDGEWRRVASVEDQFWFRVAVLQFDPVTISAVRIEVPWTTMRGTRVLDVNYSGLAGGLPPPFMGVQTASDEVVSIAAVSAWGPE